jgi:hypothetical protein
VSYFGAFWILYLGISTVQPQSKQVKLCKYCKTKQNPESETLPDPNISDSQMYFILSYNKPDAYGNT